MKQTPNVSFAKFGAAACASCLILFAGLAYASFTCNSGGLYQNGNNLGLSSLTITSYSPINRCNVQENRLTLNCTGIGAGAPAITGVSRMIILCRYV
jgi:hypothetical protein